MPELWMPGAVRDPQPQGVTLDTSLPPRGVWHITADRLDPNTGAQPPFGNVWNYLKNVGYCPNLMWDPFTGYMVQAYPANLGGRALTRWNEDGRVNLQVEIYFSPGVIRDGRKYMTVAETPCKGFGAIVDWMESWGVPRTWPMGSPQWNSTQNVTTWNTKAGHYGHIQVPGETHSDPGPMPPLPQRIVVAPPAPALLIPGLGDLHV